MKNKLLPVSLQKQISSVFLFATIFFVGMFVFTSTAFGATLVFSNDDASTNFQMFDGLTGGTTNTQYQTLTALTSGYIDYWQFYGAVDGSELSSFQIQIEDNTGSFICRGPLTTQSSGQDYLMLQFPTNGNSVLITSTTTIPNFFPCDSASLVEGNSYRIKFAASRDGSFQDGEFFTRGTSVSDFYFKAFQGEPPAPVQTQYNEVLNYIPSEGVNISVGSTTVGAVFSITDPDFVEYIGYRLFDVNNNVVYDATTTPNIEGLYEISVEYNFTSAGTYEGHAYFAQIVGEDPENVWEIDNPEAQTILVDVEQWTVDEFGQFSQNPATTSSSTISNVSLDCGEGFTGSVCNLAARLFIPSATAIGGIRVAFNELIMKAPFSFFTESKNILDAVKTGSASTGGTLSLNFYGQSVDILSTTSAASVGVQSSQINFLKFLMEVGLWILLAWYLYWRIASIFGV